MLEICLLKPEICPLRPEICPLWPDFWPLKLWICPFKSKIFPQAYNLASQALNLPWNQLKSGLKGQIWEGRFQTWESLGETDRWADRQTHKQTNKILHVFYRISSLLPLNLTYSHTKQDNGYRWPHIDLGQPICAKNSCFSIFLNIFNVL